MSGNHSDLARFVDAVARVQGRVRLAFAPVRSESGLGDMESTVLTAVTGAAHPPTVARIGRSLGHPRQVIQRAANALIERGLIAAAPNPDHKRASLLVATPAGIALQAEAGQRADALTASLMRHLDPADLRLAAEVLGRVRAGLEAHERELNG